MVPCFNVQSFHGRKWENHWDSIDSLRLNKNDCSSGVLVGSSTRKREREAFLNGKQAEGSPGSRHARHDMKEIEKIERIERIHYLCMALPIASCLLPIAYCLLPIAYCRREGSRSQPIRPGRSGKRRGLNKLKAQKMWKVITQVQVQMQTQMQMQMHNPCKCKVR